MELLVVIAIISVLASLLLPALEQALESSRRIACLSQVRQIAQGATLYSLGADDHLPARDRRWGTRWYSGDNGATPLSDLWRLEYLSNDELVVCPSKSRTTRYPNHFYYTNRFWDNAEWKGPRFSTYNAAVSGVVLYDDATGRYATYWVRMSLHAPETAFFMDIVVPEEATVTNANFWAHQTNHWNDGIMAPKGGNAVFADGHGAWHAWTPDAWDGCCFRSGQAPVEHRTLCDLHTVTQHSHYRSSGASYYFSNPWDGNGAQGPRRGHVAPW